jgi:hypothetical protein
MHLAGGGVPVAVNRSAKIRISLYNLNLQGRRVRIDVEVPILTNEFGGLLQFVRGGT